MDKKTFLSELEKRLSILVDSEKKDIINEYKDIIDEKVKHGETEEAAIASLGSIDELAKEILKAYKINPEYKSTKESVRNVVNDCSNFIERGARWLSDNTQKTIDDIKKKDKNFTLESAFELILKFILVLFLLLLMRIPFAIIRGILEGIVGMGISPFDIVTSGIIRVVMWVLYIVACAIVVVFFFKKYFNTDEFISNTNKSTNKEDSSNENDDNIAPETKEKKSSRRTREVKKNDSALKWVFKIFVFFAILLPLFFVNLGLVTALVVIIYLMAKGLIIYQALLIILGLLIIFSSVTGNIRRLLNERHVYVFPFFVGFIFVMVGGLLSIDLATKLEYYNYLPQNNLVTTVKKTEVTLDKPLEIDDDYNYQIVTDNNMASDKAIIEVTYYKQVVRINTNILNVHNKYILDVDINSVNSLSVINNIVIENLKHNKLYNYSEFYIPTIKIYTNSENANKIS